MHENISSSSSSFYRSPLLFDLYTQQINQMDCAEKMRPCQDYLDALEEERRKMGVFHRELPLSLQLVSQAIDSCRRQMATEFLFMGRSEYEETSGDAAYPLLEEFIPLKPSSPSEEDKSKETHDSSGKKPDWLRSVQLWNQEPRSATEDQSSKSLDGIETQKEGGAFHPFEGDNKKTSSRLAAAASSTAEMGSRREEKEGQSNRKARRNWSQELHRSFLQALKQLGGPHVATPKQIRELMRVDGLTNDEVKSHLQKYRLHIRRPGPSIQSSTQPPQFLVVGSIWVPPPDYTTVAQPPAGPTANGVCASVSVQLHQEKQTQKWPTSPLQWEGRDSHEEGHANSSSCTTSSFSHTITTTTSPSF